MDDEPNLAAGTDSPCPGSGKNGKWGRQESVRARRQLEVRLPRHRYTYPSLGGRRGRPEWQWQCAARIQLCKEQGARRLGFGEGGLGGGVQVYVTILGGQWQAGSTSPVWGGGM